MMNLPVLLTEIARDVLAALTGATEPLFLVLPWLLVTVGMLVLLRHLDATKVIARCVGKYPRLATLGSTLLGATLPVCSCTVLPLARGLLQAGVPVPVMMGFWASAPIFSVRKFFTVSAVMGSALGVAMGFRFVIALLVSALTIGLGGAVILGWLERRGIGISRDLPQEISSGCGCGPSRRGKLSSEIVKALRELFTLLLWLYFAFVLEKLFSIWVPLGWVPALLGKGNWFAVPIAVLFGAPLYINYAVGLGIVITLIKAGASQGAALSFLVAGSMMSIPAVVATIKLLGKGLLWRYMGITFLGASCVGIAFDLINVIFE